MQIPLTPSSPPFSLVLSGGGMRCAWSGGFITGLQDLGLIPKTIVANSGNAGSSIYFVTNQIRSIKRIYTEHLPGNRFIRWWRLSKIMDIDFLVDDVFKMREPIDWDALSFSPTQVYIACFNITKQKFDYFSNDSITYEVLRAAKAVPLIYGKKVIIDDDVYTDMSLSPYTSIKNMQPNLSEKVICIDVREKNKMIKFISKFLGFESKNDNASSSIFSITPSDPKTWLMTSSKRALTESFNDGYIYALSHKQELLDYTSR